MARAQRKRTKIWLRWEGRLLHLYCTLFSTQTSDWPQILQQTHWRPGLSKYISNKGLEWALHSRRGRKNEACAMAHACRLDAALQSPRDCPDLLWFACYAKEAETERHADAPLSACVFSAWLVSLTASHSSVHMCSRHNWVKSVDCWLNSVDHHNTLQPHHLNSDSPQLL